MKRPLLLRLLPDPLRTSVWGRFYRDKHPRWAPLYRDAELRYAQRYRTPRANPKRVVIEVKVERVLGSSELLDRS